MTIDDFKEYHATNPDIFEAFEKYTFQAIDAGRKYLGSQVILERIRFYSMVEAKQDQFKINNNYAAFYSRMFEDKHPKFKGFFRKRRSVADNLL